MMMLATGGSSLLRGSGRHLISVSAATKTSVSAAAANSSSSRTFMTTSAAARMAQRLASQGALWRFTGGVVLVTSCTAATVVAATSQKKHQPEWFSSFSSSSFQLLLQSNHDSSVSENQKKEGTEEDQSTLVEEETISDDENTNTGAVLATSANNNNDSIWNRLFGSATSSNDKKQGGEEEEAYDNNTFNSNSGDEDIAAADETCHGGPGKKVVVKLENELVDSLPVMSLADVQKCTSHKKMLVTYQGIVYDVTSFVEQHPGGSELVKTAAGLDMEHFFANYTVHGRTAKAAEWLAPLAVGKLSPEEATLARDSTTPQVHVQRRQQLLKQRRRKIIFVASTLPFWMTLRSVIGWIGFFVPPLGKLLAWAMPVTVPGLSKGSEPLDAVAAREADKPIKVAVIGGGIAGCGAAWNLAQSGFDVTLYEAREQISGNARTFRWDFSPFRGMGATVESCVSVTAWPPDFYKNYTCLLEHLGIETVHQPLSWFLNSRVPGYEGTLWEADPSVYPGSLRQVFEKDFEKYQTVVDFSRRVTRFFTLAWAPWRWNDTVSMYDTHQGLGLLNPLTVVPLYSLFKMIGGSDAWWDIVFTPQFTASFLVDELRPFPAVFGPLIEAQIPLNPNKNNSWQGPSKRSPNDCNITTCVTWKDAGKGIRKVFDLLVKDVALKENTRVREVQVLPNGKKRVFDEFDSYEDVDRVIFACPVNAVGNIYKDHKKALFADTILSTPVYADDHHPSTGHMHAVMHSDGSVIPEEHRENCLKRASNYVEITQQQDGSLNIENQYNFGVQTPGPGIYDLPLDQKPVMLISHALSEGKSIDPKLVRGTGNHARAHPLYSGWNVAAQLSLRLLQGRDGIYYCSNWTTPGNCHDMSLLSGIICAHAIGAKYPFENNTEAKKDFHRLRDLMGV